MDTASNLTHEPPTSPGRRRRLELMSMVLQRLLAQGSENDDIVPDIIAEMYRIASEIKRDGECLFILRNVELI